MTTPERRARLASMRMTASKFLLQGVVAAGGCVPVMAGLAGIVGGPRAMGLGIAAAADLDSHFRYLSGLLLGIGLCFWSTVPRIEHKGARFRLLAGIVFLGGLARLWSLFAAGVPGFGMQAGLAMELIVTPLLALWQAKLARRFERRLFSEH